MFRFRLFGAILISGLLFQVGGFKSFFRRNRSNSLRPKDDVIVQYKELDEFNSNEFSPNISIRYFKENPAERPRVVYTNRNAKNKYYTLLMLDPDAPSRKNPIYSDYLHWGIANIKGELLNKGLNGKENMYYQFMEYAPPTPPPGSGPHRYRIMLIEQKYFIYPEFLRIPQRRNNFDLAQFQKYHKLTNIIKTATFKTQDY